MRLSDKSLFSLRITRIVLIAVGAVLVLLPTLINSFHRGAISAIWSNVLLTIGSIFFAAGLAITLVVSEEFNPTLYFATSIFIIAIAILLIVVWF